NSGNHTINHVFALVLIDHITKIAVRKKVGVDQAIVIRYICLLHLCYLLHFIIKCGDPDTVAGIFIYQEMTSYFSDDLEIHFSAVFAVIIRINDLLCIQGKCQTGKNKKKE